MTLVTAVIPLLVALIGIGALVTRRQRLRSHITAYLMLYGKLPPGPDKDNFLKMINGKSRQLVSEESDTARFDRSMPPVLGIIALTAALLAATSLTTPTVAGENTDGAGVAALEMAVLFIILSGLIYARTVERLRAAYLNKPEPTFPSLKEAWRWLQNHPLSWLKAKIKV